MWYMMANTQHSYDLSERLIRAITHWNTVSTCNEDIEELLDKGADVNRIHGTVLPLHCACMMSDSETVELLLNRGAEINTRDGYGRAAVHYAAERDATCLEQLVQRGADINLRDQNEDTALHWAAYKNSTHCAHLLLQYGADVNAQDYNDDTPLGWAARKGNLQTIKILLDYNARVDLATYRGHTPLMKVAGIEASGLGGTDDRACLELLIQASGQFDFRDKDGKLPEVIERDNRTREALLPYITCARKLKDLCRYKIRQHLGNTLLANVVYKLPLPQQMQQFLLLQT